MNMLNLGQGSSEFEEGNPIVQAMRRRDHKQDSRRSHTRHRRDNQPHIETIAESMYRDLAAVGKAIVQATGRAIEAISSHLDPREQAAHHAGTLALVQSEVRREVL